MKRYGQNIIQQYKNDLNRQYNLGKKHGSRTGFLLGLATAAFISAVVIGIFF